MPFSLSTIFLVSAIGGGVLLVLQILATLVGGDADVDGDMDAGFDGDTGGLSFRTVVAFVTFFGIAGSAALSSGMGPWSSRAVAVVAGSLAFWLVGLAMLQLSRLRSSGNVEIENAIEEQLEA